MLDTPSKDPLHPLDPLDPLAESSYRIQIFLEDRWTDPSLETLKTHV